MSHIVNLLSFLGATWCAHSASLAFTLRWGSRRVPGVDCWLGVKVVGKDKAEASAGYCSRSNSGSDCRTCLVLPVPVAMVQCECSCSGFAPRRSQKHVCWNVMGSFAASLILGKMRPKLGSNLGHSTGAWCVSNSGRLRGMPFRGARKSLSWLFVTWKCILFLFSTKSGLLLEGTYVCSGLNWMLVICRAAGQRIGGTYRLDLASLFYCLGCKVSC